MKVKDLINEIERCKEEYDDFLEWDVYTEQIGEVDGHTKSTITGFQDNWRRVTDSEGWEYFECAGFWTKFADKKIFTININY